MCAVSRKCIPQGWTCDGEPDCGANDNSDEDPLDTCMLKYTNLACYFHFLVYVSVNLLCSVCITLQAFLKITVQRTLLGVDQLIRASRFS